MKYLTQNMPKRSPHSPQIRFLFKKKPSSLRASRASSGQGVPEIKTSMFRSSFRIPLLLFTIFHFAQCDATTQTSNFGILDSESLRTDFINATTHQQTNILLQEDGSTDEIKYIFLKLTDGLAPENVTFVQTSTNLNVLNFTKNENIDVSSSAANVLNVTCTLSFENMVGKTSYSLKAINAVTLEEIDSITIPFIIAGMSFYTESAEGIITVVSGKDNGYYISYEDALNRIVQPTKQIMVSIQLPDGRYISTSKDLPIPSIETMQSSLSKVSGQLQHEATVCDISKIGKLSDTGYMELPTGCGYGFFEGFSNHICFGIDFEPYRAGEFSIAYSWSGLTASNTILSEDIFYVNIDVYVTGEPPIAIVGLSPLEKLWRPEGGELVNLQIRNAVARNASSFRISVTNVSSPFSSVYGSFQTIGAPNFTETISFVTEQGNGTELDWNFEYIVGNATSSTVQAFETAVAVPGFQYLFSYDNNALRIDSLSPDFGAEGGGTKITITGYFPSFDLDVDGIYFSGTKLPRQYIASLSESELLVVLPPKSKLGDSYEFWVTVQMGNAFSNRMLFSYVVKDALVRISQSGTSEIDEETFQVGNCTDVSFTAIITPFTNQIQFYKWTLSVLGSDSDLLSTPAFQSANYSAQTIQLDPDYFAEGLYVLKVVAGILGKDIETEILLKREYVITIGAFILNPPMRTIAFPDAPLRLSAVIKSPGECYTGNQTMMFQWTAFGKTQVFSSSNATGSPVLGNFTTTPARLGWEYVIPREELKSGNETISFKVWMADDLLVSGRAFSHVFIDKAQLVPVIRHGEQHLSANYASKLTFFSTKSYDPDVLSGDKTAGLTYEWFCRQSTSTNFSQEASSTCLPALLPNTFSSEFSVAILVLESELEITHLQYSLIVRKVDQEGIRVSPATTLTVEIQNRGTLPSLNDYEISLTNNDGVIQDWNNVAHFERSIITVTSSFEVSWTYALIEPSIPDFFSQDNLITKPPTFFSADVHSVTGNTRPLGIEAGKLSPFTTYKFKILFDVSQEHESTSVIVSLQTAEAPIVGLAVPSVLNGTTNTTFTATAGIPKKEGITGFSYYFIITDESGNKFCVAGCTGYEVAHFRVGRAGNYSLSAYIYDMQGKSLIDSKTLHTNLTIADTGNSTDYLRNLATLFENGDDNSWTQLAHDLALLLLEPEPTESTIRMLMGETARQGISSEDLLDVQMQSALNISDGARKIFCGSYPNSYHGSDCMSLSSDLVKLPLLDEVTVYNILITVQCCVENTPLRTMNKMGAMFPSFLNNVNNISGSIENGGNTRRRLLQNSAGEPPNLSADVKTWTTTQFPASITSGQLDGYTQMLKVGDDQKYGHISIVVASNLGHLPVKNVNGTQRRVIMGPSEDELFYATGTCLSNLFSPAADRKRFFVLYSVDNFVTNKFQDEPEGSNLADKLYWQQVFEQDVDGRFIPVALPQEDQCFCWRLPILHKIEFIKGSVEFMAGMYTVTDLKDFGVDTEEKGVAYKYVYEGQFTKEFNPDEGWVEACQDRVGMVASTLVSRSVQNALGNGAATILGTGSAIIVGLVVGGLLFVVVAMASAWIFATRAMSDVAAPMAALAPSELYVERDVYGRGTIFDVNAVTLPSGDQ